MKIEISAKLFNYVSTIMADTKMRINPTGSRAKGLNFNDVKNIKRKWVTVSKSGDSVAIELNDDMICDTVGAYYHFINRLVPVGEMVKSMIPVIRTSLKDVIVDTKAVFNNLSSKWEDEYEYVVIKVVNPEVIDYGYVVARRIKGEAGTYTYTDFEIKLIDSLERNLPYESAKQLKLNEIENLMEKINGSDGYVGPWFSTRDKAIDQMLNLVNMCEEYSDMPICNIQYTAHLDDETTQYALVPVVNETGRFARGYVLMYRANETDQYSLVAYMIEANDKFYGSEVSSPERESEKRRAAEFTLCEYCRYPETFEAIIYNTYNDGINAMVNKFVGVGINKNCDSKYIVAQFGPDNMDRSGTVLLYGPDNNGDFVVVKHNITLSSNDMLDYDSDELRTKVMNRTANRYARRFKKNPTHHKCTYITHDNLEDAERAYSNLVNRTSCSEPDADQNDVNDTFIVIEVPIDEGDKPVWVLMKCSMCDGLTANTLIMHNIIPTPSDIEAYPDKDAQIKLTDSLARIIICEFEKDNSKFKYEEFSNENDAGAAYMAHIIAADDSADKADDSGEDGKSSCTIEEKFYILSVNDPMAIGGYVLTSPACETNGNWCDLAAIALNHKSDDNMANCFAKEIIAINTAKKFFQTGEGLIKTFNNIVDAKDEMDRRWHDFDDSEPMCENVNDYVLIPINDPNGTHGIAIAYRHGSNDPSMHLYTCNVQLAAGIKSSLHAIARENYIICEAQKAVDRYNVDLDGIYTTTDLNDAIRKMNRYARGFIEYSILDSADIVPGTRGIVIMGRPAGANWQVAAHDVYSDNAGDLPKIVEQAIHFINYSDKYVTPEVDVTFNPSNTSIEYTVIKHTETICSGAIMACRVKGCKFWIPMYFHSQFTTDITFAMACTIIANTIARINKIPDNVCTYPSLASATSILEDLVDQLKFE